MGGRQVRTQGNIWDHFAVEYEYPNGVRVLSMCRQINGCTDNVSEHIVGAIGTCYTDSGGGRIYGTNAYDYKGPNPNPYVEEHKNLIASIRNGALNEGKTGRRSTMTAISAHVRLHRRARVGLGHEDRNTDPERGLCCGPSPSARPVDLNGISKKTVMPFPRSNAILM